MSSRFSCVVANASTLEIITAPEAPAADGTITPGEVNAAASFIAKASPAGRGSSKYRALKASASVDSLRADATFAEALERYFGDVEMLGIGMTPPVRAYNDARLARIRSIMR